MKAKFYTLMVVPHQGRRPRTVMVSRRFLLTAGALLTSLLIAGVLTPRFYLENRWQAESLTNLRQRNLVLSESINEVGVQVGDLRARMEYYERQARKFALMAGMENLPGDMGASGGPAADDGFGPFSRSDSVRQELSVLASREERLTRHFQVLDMAYQERQAFLEAMPTSSPLSEGYLGSPYGWRRDPFNGQRVFHHGQDLVASTGTPIRAPAAGKVLRADRVGGLGLAIFLSHGQGFVSRYGHLSRLKVKRGQRVERGDIIGYVGSTGRSMGSHLHYEILVEGKQVDPRDYLLEDPRPPVG